MSWLKGIAATLLALVGAVLAVRAASKHDRRADEHDGRAALAKRDHRLKLARQEKARGDRERKRAENARARADQRIEEAADRHETPDVDDVVARYNSRVRERARNAESVD